MVILQSLLMGGVSLESEKHWDICEQRVKSESEVVDATLKETSLYKNWDQTRLSICELTPETKSEKNPVERQEAATDPCERAVKEEELNAAEVLLNLHRGSLEKTQAASQNSSTNSSAPSLRAILTAPSIKESSKNCHCDSNSTGRKRKRCDSNNLSLKKAFLNSYISDRSIGTQTETVTEEVYPSVRQWHSSENLVAQSGTCSQIVKLKLENICLRNRIKMLESRLGFGQSDLYFLKETG